MPGSEHHGPSAPKTLQDATASAAGTEPHAPLPRLKSRSEFLRVARGGRKCARPGLVLQAARREQNGDGGSRVGFTASRKVGNAVKRNRVRRRLVALAADVMPLHAAPGHDYVLIGRQATADRPFGSLRRDLEGALKRLDVFRPARSE